MPVDKFMQKRIAEMRRAQQQAAQSGKARAGGSSGQQLIIPEATHRVESQTPQNVQPSAPTTTPGTARGDDYEIIDLSPSSKQTAAQSNREPSITIGPPTITTGPVPPEGETLQTKAVPRPLTGYGGTLNDPSRGNRSAVPPLTDPNRVVAQAESIFNKISVQKHSYREIKDGYDLLGGTNGYVYTGNSRDRGVRVDFPGASARYNTNPRATESMARMAIPFSLSKDIKNVSDFCVRNGLSGDATKLATRLLFQGNSGLGYIDFLLQNVTESFSEKVQISETVGDNYAAFFFGMAPPTFSFAGQLLNTFQDEWRSSMHIIYQWLLRGTRLARTNTLVSIYYDRIIATGYMLSHNQNYTAELQMASSFQFNMLVKSVTFSRLPRTVPSKPDKLAGDLTFGPVTGLRREAISRTTRTVNVANVESTPAKEPLTPEQAQVETQNPEYTPAGKRTEPLPPRETQIKNELYAYSPTRFQKTKYD